MGALEIRRSVAKFGIARIASAVAPATAAKLGPLELRTIDDPPCPGAGWQRVHTRLSGICGSDLSLVEGHASAYFDDFVSFPFVPGHEVVGELEDGRRVVLEPDNVLTLGLVVVLVCLIASGLGVRAALRIDPATAMGG